MSTVQLSDLARITGRTRDTIRNMQNRDGTPWDDAEFEGEGRRRYGVRHALSLILCELLEAQRVSASDAAEFVRDQRLAIKSFLAEIATGSAPAPRFVVAAYLVDEIAGRASTTRVVFAGYGTAEEMTDLFAGELAATGRERTRRRFGEDSIVRRVAGPMMAVAPVSEAFRLLNIRAAQAGFSVTNSGFRKADGALLSESSNG